MSNTYTSNTKLAMPAVGDTGWAVPVNQNAATLDGMGALGPLCCTTAEVPSASLNVAVAGGTMVNSSGVLVAYAGTASQAVSANATTYLWLSDAGSLQAGTGWPAAGTKFVPIAKVVAGGSAITSVADQRVVFRSVSQ